MYNKESELSKLPSEEFHQTYIEEPMKKHLDYGKRHYGKYAAYLRVSTDMQDVEGQEFAIKEYLNGGEHDVRWFVDDGVSSGARMDKRQGLQDALKYCRKHDATLIIYDISRLSRKVWESLKFLEQEVTRAKLKFVIVKSPRYTKQSIMLESMMAEMQRDSIREKTQNKFKHMKAVLAEKGVYKTSTGKLIKKLGNPDIKNVSKQGGAAVAKQADTRAQFVGPVIKKMREDRHMTWRAIATELNKLGVSSPGSQKSQEGNSKDSQWHGSTARNLYLRWEKQQ